MKRQVPSDFSYGPSPLSGAKEKIQKIIDEMMNEAEEYARKKVRTDGSPKESSCASFNTDGVNFGCDYGTNPSSPEVVVSACPDCCGQGKIWTLPKSVNWVGFATSAGCSTCNGLGKIYTTPGMNSFSKAARR